MNLAVVIPSKNIDNLRESVRSVQERDPAVSIYVVDDAPQDDNRIADLCMDEDLLWVGGARPFVFAKNCNLGLRRAFEDGADGVVLMNDDSMLETLHGLTRLGERALLSPEYGIIAASCNGTGNPNQRQRTFESLREEPRMVCFVCVYIPRMTIETVGYLDERYVHYGLEDDDYCFMVRKAGLKLGIFDGCFVDHLSLTSSFRGDPKAPSDFRQNMQIFIDKWGHDNWGVPADEARQKWAVPA